MKCAEFLRTRLFLAFSLTALAASLWFQASDTAWAADQPLKLSPEDRILVLAPHPDDEILGCAGVIQRAVQMGLPIKLVFLTYGDSNPWAFAVYRKRPVLTAQAARRMGVVRQEEALSAARILGLSADQLIFLGYPDFGTLNIWYAHWGDAPPFKSMLTRVRRVPYENALRFGAPYKAEEILSDLEGLAREFRPTKVFVSHAADHNPDHRALYLFSHVALWNLEPALRPQVYAYLIHYPQWPHPKGDHPDAKLKPPARLQEMVQWSSFLLGDEEVRNKKKALQAHRSQYQYSAKSLLSFVRSNELFGEFPQIFLTTKPSPAGLFPEGSEGFLEMPDGLTDEEKTFFTEVRWQSVWTEREDIVLSLTFSRPLTERTAASVYLFGYRQGRLFQEMPKIQIRLGRLGHVVLDQKRSISREIVTIERKPREVRLRISRKAMGNPDRLLVGARTYSGEVPLDWASWRTLHLPQAD